MFSPLNKPLTLRIFLLPRRPSVLQLHRRTLWQSGRDYCPNSHKRRRTLSTHQWLTVYPNSRLVAKTLQAYPCSIECKRQWDYSHCLCPLLPASSFCQSLQALKALLTRRVFQSSARLIEARWNCAPEPTILPDSPIAPNPVSLSVHCCLYSESAPLSRSQIVACSV